MMASSSIERWDPEERNEGVMDVTREVAVATESRESRLVPPPLRTDPSEGELRICRDGLLDREECEPDRSSEGPGTGTLRDGTSDNSDDCE